VTWEETNKKPNITEGRWLPDPLPGNELEAVAGPSWNGFDTFLRRGVMIAAFVILWTFIVVSLFTMGAILNAVHDANPNPNVTFNSDQVGE
jgi:hypothetical protein